MIAPTSRVYLLNVPFDDTQRHQLWFETETDQYNYFYGRRRFEFTEMQYIRDYKAIRVEKNIDKMYDVNYIMYQNDAYSDKWFYGFVIDMKYINDDVTELYIKLDVIQTWFFDVTYRPSYIKRQHVTDDRRGANRIDENLNISEMVQTDLNIDVSYLTDVGYIVATNYAPDDVVYRGRIYSGVYSGICYLYYGSDEVTQMAEDIEKIETKHEGAISFICCIPKLAKEDATVSDNHVIQMDSVSMHTITKDLTNITLDGYKPKNNKLYNYPFTSLYVTTHNGQSNNYMLEYFTNQANIKFDVYADISGSPTVRLVPRQYKGLEWNYDEGLILQGFPQCSYDVDTYKIWLQKNIGTLGINAVSSGLNIVGGLATGNVGSIVSGARGIAELMNENYQHSMTPLQAKGSIGSGSLNIGMGINTFHFYLQTLNKEYAKAIDNYFTMFGYRINNVQIPNIHARRYFTYIETAELNIISKSTRDGVPDKDLTEIKTIFNNGVTFWADPVNILNYDCDNEVI